MYDMAVINMSTRNCPKNIPNGPTAFQVALNPLRFTEPSLWKKTVMVFPELMMGLGMLDPQYFFSTGPEDT